MGNCLVTKLQSVVDNDRLAKLGVINATVRPVENPSKETRNLYVYNSPESTENVVIRDVTGNACLVDVGSGENPSDWNSDPRATNEVILSPGYAFLGVTLNKSAKIEISGKYNIMGLQFGDGYAINGDSLFIPKATFQVFLSNCYIDGSLASLKSSLPSNDLSEVTFSGLHNMDGSLVGNVYELLVGKQFNVMNITYCWNTFDLNTILEGKTNMHSLYLGGNLVYGDISVFLTDNQLTYPRMQRLGIGQCPNLTKPAAVIARLRELGVTVFDD